MKVRRGVQPWFERHAQTLVGSLGRIVQNPLSTVMTMAVIAVALALPLFLNVFLQNLRLATANWNQAIDISVYMEKKVGSARAQAVAKSLRGRPDVTAVRIITAEAALAEFRKASGFGDALDALNENPLPDTLVVTPALTSGTPAAMEALKVAILAMADVQTVQADTQWVTRLYGMIDILRRVIWLTGAMLGLGVVLVVGNTIRLDILNRRAEIEVMKLVGATDGFARRPFLYSGLWYGLGGGMLAVALCIAAVGLLTAPVQHLAALYGGTFRLQGLGFGPSTAMLAVVDRVGLAWLLVSSHPAHSRHSAYVMVVSD